MTSTRTTAMLCLLFTVCTPTESAMALDKKDILGKWCTGQNGVAQFSTELTTDYMKLAQLPANTGVQLKVIEFEVTANAIFVRWIGVDGVARKSGYTNFSADGQKMVQMKTGASPEMPHWRC